MEDKIKNYLATIGCIKECLIDYSTPLYITGNIDVLVSLATVIISAEISKKELIIINDKYPEWLKKILNNLSKENNILIIKDFDKISTEEQKLFIDIICNNQISSEKLPDNLKIIINAEQKWQLIQEIREVVQYFEL